MVRAGFRNMGMFDTYSLHSEQRNKPLYMRIDGMLVMLVSINERELKSFFSEL